MKTRILGLILVVLMVCMGLVSFTACNNDPVSGKELKFEYCYFGYCPQTMINEKDINCLSTSPDDHEYYKDAEDNYYVKLNELVPFFPNTRGTFTNGTSINNVYAPEDKEKKNPAPHYFKVEPIKWRKFDFIDNDAPKNEEHKVFLISDKILGAINFDNKNNNYKDSFIRKWLNGSPLDEGIDVNVASERYPRSFIDSVFTFEEKTAICRTKIENNLQLEKIGDKYLIDQIFLLSYDDVINKTYRFNFNPQGDSFDKARQILAVDYARATNLAFDSDNYFGCGYWWLRTSPQNKSLGYIVGPDGKIAKKPLLEKEIGNIGVVPALVMLKNNFDFFTDPTPIKFAPQR